MFQSQIHSIENVLHLCFHSEVEAWGLLSLIVWDAEPAGWLCWFRQSRLDTAGREDTAGLMEISCAILQAAPLSVGQRVSSPDCNIISTPTSTPTSLQCNTSSQSKTIKPPPAQSRTAGLEKKPYWGWSWSHHGFIHTDNWFYRGIIGWISVWFKAAMTDWLYTGWQSLEMNQIL